MHALLVDSPAASGPEQPAAADRAAGGSARPPAGDPPQQQPPGRTCVNCEAPLREGQEWCLQCGAGQPGSLGERPNWRPLSTLALAAILLTGAAAAAGAAALGAHKTTPPRTLTVAQAPLPTTPTTSTPTTPRIPGTTSTPTAPALKTPKGGTGASNPLFPATKPPKIPAPATTPPATGTGTGAGTGTGTGTGTSTGAGESTSGTKTGAGEKPSTTGTSPSGEAKTPQPSAILLDTNAAGTYNPYNYPEAGFGDPALAIDGEASTAWTAQVQPSSAPNMAEGLVIDLNTATKLGAVKLVTQTPGMTVQIYGANGKQAPATITAPGWLPLSSSRVLKKKATHVKLRAYTQGLRFLVVWIVKAPASAVGTPQAPGHVDLNEVELFPPTS
ncbi:MAG TPA: hypothetical protein VK756_11010 [Solirubrobacteraceae bacterium]|nr:hypothetical protein [Solirubrobacteraceae bacterium]